MKLIVRRDKHEKNNAPYSAQLHFYDEKGFFTFSVHQDWLDDPELSGLARAVDIRGEVELHLVWPDEEKRGCNTSLNSRQLENLAS